jgi:ArsR family transcriptional regulator
MSVRALKHDLALADLAGIRALLGFLVQDCCQGQLETCGPLLEAVLPLAACCPTLECITDRARKEARSSAQ